MYRAVLNFQMKMHNWYGFDGFKSVSNSGWYFFSEHSELMSAVKMLFKTINPWYRISVLEIFGLAKQWPFTWQCAWASHEKMSGFSLWYILYISTYLKYCFHEKSLLLSEQTYPVKLVMLKYLLYKYSHICDYNTCDMGKWSWCYESMEHTVTNVLFGDIPITIFHVAKYQIRLKVAVYK